MNDIGGFYFIFKGGLIYTQKKQLTDISYKSWAHKRG